MKLNEVLAEMHRRGYRVKLYNEPMIAATPWMIKASIVADAPMTGYGVDPESATRDMIEKWKERIREQRTENNA